HTEGESDDAVQARPGCSEKMAAPARLRAVNACSGRKGFPGWSVTGRRLIQNRWNTRFDNTSFPARGKDRADPPGMQFGHFHRLIIAICQSAQAACQQFA